MKQLLLFITLAITAYTAYSQEDYEGCTDHPMFNRMPNYYIGECSRNYGIADFVMEDGNTKSIEGYKTYIFYTFDADQTQELPSFYQVFKNFENSLKKHNVKKVYLASQYGTLFFKTANKSVWITIECPGENADWYSLTIVEIEEMKQDIQASEMLDALNKDGHIALYINFETGKSVIKPESQNIIDQIAEMMIQNPGLKISIEGHTDNAGNAASNQTLSVDRANAAMDALIAKEIDKSRLTAKGFGQNKPIASNDTEEGRALNRRVEIVKQ